jgi:hypothetical protein
MLVVGILPVRAGVWEGWRRFAPFLVGLALPAAFAAASVFGGAWMGVTFASMTTAGFFTLGYSVCTGSGAHGRE